MLDFQEHLAGRVIEARDPTTGKKVKARRPKPATDQPAVERRQEPDRLGGPQRLPRGGPRPAAQPGPAAAGDQEPRPGAAAEAPEGDRAAGRPPGAGGRPGPAPHRDAGRGALLAHLGPRRPHPGPGGRDDRGQGRQDPDRRALAGTGGRHSSTCGSGSRRSTGRTTSGRSTRCSCSARRDAAGGPRARWGRRASRRCSHATPRSWASRSSPRTCSGTPSRRTTRWPAIRLTLVQYWMGHSRLETTAIYTDSTPVLPRHVILDAAETAAVHLGVPIATERKNNELRDDSCSGTPSPQRDSSRSNNLIVTHQALAATGLCSGLCLLGPNPTQVGSITSLVRRKH